MSRRAQQVFKTLGTIFVNHNRDVGLLHFLIIKNTVLIEHLLLLLSLLLLSLLVSSIINLISS